MAKANVTDSTTSAQPKTAEDPHLAWEREAAVIWKRELPEFPGDPKAEDAVSEARRREWEAVVARIADTPACTPDGIAAQILLAIFSDDEGSTLSEIDVRGLKSAVAALERMATNDARLATTSAEKLVQLSKQFFDFNVEVFSKVNTRFAIVGELAAWFQSRDQSVAADELPFALVQACEDLRDKLDELNDYVHRFGLDVRKALEQA